MWRDVAEHDEIPGCSTVDLLEHLAAREQQAAEYIETVTGDMLEHFPLDQQRRGIPFAIVIVRYEVREVAARLESACIVA
ncbi:hypothetical protein D3C76_1582440 [compost metagenome]